MPGVAPHSREYGPVAPAGRRVAILDFSTLTSSNHRTFNSRPPHRPTARCITPSAPVLETRNRAPHRLRFQSPMAKVELINHGYVFGWNG
jgi:hypothetical protein